MESAPETEPTILDYAAQSEDAKWPITFPILLAHHDLTTKCHACGNSH